MSISDSKKIVNNDIFKNINEIFNNINEIDFILYESTFIRYISCYSSMLNFVNVINRDCDYNNDPNFIKYDGCDSLLELGNYNDLLQILILKYGELGSKFENYIYHNSNTDDIKKIENKIEAASSLIKDTNNINNVINCINIINGIIYIIEN